MSDDVTKTLSQMSRTVQFHSDQRVQGCTKFFFHGEIIWWIICDKWGYVLTNGCQWEKGVIISLADQRTGEN